MPCCQGNQGGVSHGIGIGQDHSPWHWWYPVPALLTRTFGQSGSLSTRPVRPSLRLFPCWLFVCISCWKSICLRTAAMPLEEAAIWHYLGSNLTPWESRFFQVSGYCVVSFGYVSKNGVPKKSFRKLEMALCRLYNLNWYMGEQRNESTKTYCKQTQLRMQVGNINMHKIIQCIIM